MVRYFSAIVIGLLSVLKGMAVTVKYFFSKKVTMEYPDQRWKMPDRFRGKVGCDTNKCISCLYCVNICPVSCITLENVKAEIPAVVTNLEGKEMKRLKNITKFEVDISRCIFCGLCTEGCPTGAIYMSHDYEISCYTRKDMVYQWVKTKL
ncbi:MAG: NADH-quinone oxidoreductase subunit I [Planctomycetota bacterium]|nr:NADH-quinone oxidoreductase subunit I [Planctomycetota bacterium]MDI6788369.1 NADH-quinone oxidoreductase subunit I [Planctomycetota bacterium]